MSFISGLIVGGIIAALQLFAGHAQLEYRTLSFTGNGALALAVPSVLVPLAILWGWTWVSDRWSGRSGPPLLLFTLGLVVTSAAAFPIEYAVFPPSGSAFFIGTLADLIVVGVLYILPVVALAAVLYWAFGSGRVSVRLSTLALAYLVALPLALLLPTLTMGTVAGTAAGHAWRSPGARASVALLVIMLMLVATFELPLAASAVGPTALGR